MQRWADGYAIVSAVLSAVTGLAVWGLVAQSNTVWARIIVSFVALAAAVAAIVPKVKQFAEAAGKARELASQYGSIKGRLLDAQGWMDNQHSDAALRQLVADFEAIKKSKDLLNPYPAEAQNKRNIQKTV